MHTLSVKRSVLIDYSIGQDALKQTHSSFDLWVDGALVHTSPMAYGNAPRNEATQWLRDNSDLPCGNHWFQFRECCRDNSIDLYVTARLVQL